MTIMKTFLVLAVCLIALSEKTLAAPEKVNNRDLMILKCYQRFKLMDSYNDVDMNKLKRLDDHAHNCLIACLFKAHGWIRPDGSVDSQLIYFDRNVDETKMRKYMNLASECRAKVGKDDCNFVSCLGKKVSDLDSLTNT